MNILFEDTLKLLRKAYSLIGSTPQLPELQCETDKTTIQNMMIALLRSQKPCMIARFGSIELDAVVNYEAVRDSHKHSLWKFIKGEERQWWWNRDIINSLQTNAGFFPLTEENVCRFAERMIADARQVDILGSWRQQEYYLSNALQGARKVALQHLEPAYFDNENDIPSWTAELKGKRVLVIHPFTETIKQQYKRRDLLFSRPDILPEFDLLTLQAIQSIGGKVLGGAAEFSNWFEALKWMENQMDVFQYDICLIGCGAYGFPLAAHAKQTGHKAIHLGGALQLLFGIKGKRWEERLRFQNIFNDYWVHPSKEETPETAVHVEGGCYW